jgi:hypothetical protein
MGSLQESHKVPLRRWQQASQTCARDRERRICYKCEVSHQFKSHIKAASRLFAFQIYALPVLTHHSERQYKVQIEKWNFERNVKQHEGKAIVKKVRRRKATTGKDTRCIRVRGHKINAEKLGRWMRELESMNSYLHMPMSPAPRMSIQYHKFRRTNAPRNSIQHQYLYGFHSIFSCTTITIQATQTGGLFGLFVPRS